MTDSSIGAYEAKTHLPRLLEQVERGATVTITKHGRPVARLVPVDARSNPESVIEELRNARRGVLLQGSVRDLVEEGRR